ncbi:hypothetical protein Ahy_A08g038116 isoform D [Arachis hypogaea]|uniref:Alcohol dehydrogenase 1 n=1 Tax=Arachis hypogaea TaxID=3818 RepID=A0A445BSN0_ARAHY|nr:hypothetical protein Ahy_A08g038116 isoform D [Arachis hypogaea]
MSNTAGQIIKCRAAVAWEAGKPLVIEEVEVAPPKAGEVRLKILYTSLCHTDVYFWEAKGQTPLFPRIFGHEAGGYVYSHLFFKLSVIRIESLSINFFVLSSVILYHVHWFIHYTTLYQTRLRKIVESVGEGVTHLKPGDHALPVFTGECGECPHCKSEESNMCDLLRINTDRGVMIHDQESRFSIKGKPIYHFVGTSTFSEYTVVHAGCVAKINPEAPLDKVCVLSCGICTGLGATINVAKPKPGSSVAVFGLGAVGLAAAEGARISGASRIIGVDLVSSRFELAKKFGVNEFVNPKDHNKPVQEVIAEMTNGGVDRSVECTGSIQAMISAFECVHDGWGVAVLVGVPSKDDAFKTHPTNFLNERTLKGTFYGNYKPRTDLPNVVEKYMRGELELEKFITHTVPFSEINKAFDLMLKGESISEEIVPDRGRFSFREKEKEKNKNKREESAGVIREVLPDGSCKVALGSSGNGETITALPNEMEAVVPRKSDKIKIMGGALRGSTGKLIGVDGTDGIVKVSIVSVVYSQSELLQKEVFLVELVDSITKSKELMSHLKAVYFLRPTTENIQHLRRQLAAPRFGEYHLFFSNILKDTQIHILADSDEHEAVQQVQEFYADFVAVDPYHFTLHIPSSYIYMLPAVVDPSTLQRFCDRVVDGVAAVFLALKRRPVIRYQRTSDIAKRIAHEANKLMYQEESGLFDFRRTEVSPLLLALDRRDDPVTPLLNQWTYQAMVHELIGIQDNKVDLKSIDKFSKDQEEVVLSSEQDSFFKANMYENFGDIGMNIKRLVDEFQQVSKSNQNIQTIEDMAKFVDNYPEYRKMHGNVSKHVTLVTEMSKIVQQRKLMTVSQTEQELACNGGQGAAFEAVTNLLNDDSISDVDRLRLVMLYALRYEKDSPVQLMQLFNKLASRSAKYKSGFY